PNTLLKLSSSGFEIGNHGYLHRDHAKLTHKQNIDEIALTERTIDSVLGALPDYANCKLFAPPSGSLGSAMFDACKELDYKVIMWTRDTIDWRDHDANVIYERAIRDIKAGDLILMHPTDCTVEALPRILQYIKSAGLSADTVSNVIAAN
ncbi:MAG: polysaccharide deacetylase family protein, partial [Clostridia bacterium]|nr:polysaccharide deacetylase family protein [Clostridia bacterium]